MVSYSYGYHQGRIYQWELMDKVLDATIKTLGELDEGLGKLTKKLGGE